VMALGTKAGRLTKAVERKEIAESEQQKLLS